MRGIKNAARYERWWECAIAVGWVGALFEAVGMIDVGSDQNAKAAAGNRTTHPFGKT
jgi:hypothetical protein